MGRFILYICTLTVIDVDRSSLILYILGLLVVRVIAQPVNVVVVVVGVLAVDFSASFKDFSGQELNVTHKVEVVADRFLL